MRVGRLLTDDLDALLAQTAFVPAVVPVKLLIFLAAGQPNPRRVDDHNEVALIGGRDPRGLVLALKQAGGMARDAAEHLAVRIDDVPQPVNFLAPASLPRTMRSLSAGFK